MMTCTEHDSIWNQIAFVPVVNLDNRPERWNRLLVSSKECVPAEKLRRISAVVGRDLPSFKDPKWFKGKPTDARWAARAGCTLSHRKIMEMAESEDQPFTLVIEDDADFSKIYSSEFSYLLEQLIEDHTSWDVCYLGYSKATGPALLKTQVGTHSIFEVSGCATTHAYLVNARARNWILKNLPTEAAIWTWIAKHRAIDRWYARHLSRNLRVIAISPALIPQSEGYSDILQQEVDYEIEFPGKVTKISNSDLTYQYARFWWRITCLVASSYDSLRYLIKRSNGF